MGKTFTARRIDNTQKLPEGQPNQQEQKGQTLGPPEDSANVKLIQEDLIKLLERIVNNEIARDGVEVEETLKVLKDKTRISIKSLRSSLENLLGPKETKRQDKVSADSLVTLTMQEQVELFHDKSGVSYVTLPIDDLKENWKLRSDGFRRWLRRLWYQEKRKGVSRNVLDDALDTLDGKATYEGKEHDVYTRIAHKDGAIYVDLCDNNWRCVKISAEGVEIVADSPVKFVRMMGMLPLPEPVIGGNAADKITKLRGLLNVDDTAWKRIVAWILSTYSEGPYWILILTGEQGTAKSFATRLIRLTVDPNLFELVTAPQEQRDVIFAAVNGHVQAIDNLSGISPWLSDLLCGIATGTATRMRAYHTNDGTEVAFTAKKPIIMNGIDLAIRDDLASRALPVSLLQITNHKNEKKLRQEFQTILPEVLGGIFDILVEILKNLPNMETPPIRMADAGRWVMAAEQALGWSEGEFMRVYEASRDETANLAIESDIFGVALVELLQEQSNWAGSWKELNSTLMDANQKPPHGWPRNGQAMAGKLKRLAPALRHLGYQYKPKRTSNMRGCEFTKIEKVAVEASLPSQVSGSNIGEACSNDTSPGHMTQRQLHVSFLEAPLSDSYDTSDTHDTLDALFSDEESN